MRISDWSSDVCSSDLPLPRSAQLVFVSDFLMPLEDIERALRYYGQGGQRGALLQVLDPAEESLPYDGRVRFDGLEQEPSWLISRVEARSEEHTSELQSLMRISYAVFCLKKKTNK